RAVGRIGVGESVAFAGTVGTVDAKTTSGRGRGSGVFFAIFVVGLAANFDVGLAVLDFAAAGLAFAGFLSAAGTVAAGFAGFAASAGLAASAGALKASAIAHPNSPRGTQRLKAIPSLRPSRPLRPHPKIPLPRNNAAA